MSIAAGFVLLALTQRGRLTWKPEVGSSRKYSVHLTGVSAGTKVDIRYTWTQKILARVEETMLTEEDFVHCDSYWSGVQEVQPSAHGPADRTYRLTRTSLGEATGYQDKRAIPDWPRFTPVGDLFFDLLLPEKSVSMGGKWSKKYGANRSLEFTYKGWERVDANEAQRILCSMTFEPGPDDVPSVKTGTGSFWISPLDGSLVKADLTIGGEKQGLAHLHEVVELAKN